MHVPRLCILNNDGSGYGFNLECERGKFGQFVRNIRAGSPAERGGLRSHDRVVEVNGKNVEEFTHQQVVTQIKENEQAVGLLVVDPETDAYFAKRGVRVTGALLNRRADSEIELDRVGTSGSLRSRDAVEKSLDGSLNEFADASINNLNVATASGNQQNGGNGNGQHANVSQSGLQAAVAEPGVRRPESSPQAVSMNRQPKLDAVDNDALQTASIDGVRARLNAKRGEKIAVKQNNMSFQQKSAVFDSL